MNKHASKGFTIVELIIVVVAMGLMIAISAVPYMQVQMQTRDDERNAHLTILITELEKYYNTVGEYPPGCPDATCPNAMHTTNTSSVALTSNTTLATLRSVLPGIKDEFGDPQSPDATLPLKNRTIAEKKYYYFGGTVNYTTAAATLDSATTANFPCTIRSSLTPGQVGSYVAGYFNEGTDTWILKGGRGGIPMTVVAGTCVIVRA